MGLLHGHCSWWRGEELDCERAVQFVRAHTSWTNRGLTHAGDPATVALVLGRHDAQHPNWLSLIAALRSRLGPAAADRAEAVYALQGVAAGVLVTSRSGYGPVIAAQARAVLSEQLAAATKDAVREIRTLAPPVLQVVLDG